MKLWHWALVTGMLISHVALTAPLDDKLKNLPEEVLQDGLTVASACVATQSAGIQALTKIGRAEMAEPSQNSNQIRGKALHDAESLFTGLQLYAKLGTAIADALIEDYRYTNEQINNLISDQLQSTRKDIIKKLDDPIEYSDFQERFDPIQAACNTATELFAKKVEQFRSD